MQKKTIKVWYWIITILFSAFMLMSATQELAHTASADKVMTDLGYPIYLNTILGIAKILGVIAILQTKWFTIKEWAYAGFTIDIVGALLSSILAGSSVIMTILMFIPFLVVLTLAYYLWKKVRMN